MLSRALAKTEKKDAARVADVATAHEIAEQFTGWHVFSSRDGKVRMATRTGNQQDPGDGVYATTLMADDWDGLVQQLKAQRQHDAELTYAGPLGMTLRSFYRRLVDAEVMLKNALPGWDCWSITPSSGKTTWHARPEGAPGAVVDAGSADHLLLLARAYQSQLHRHIQETARQLEALPQTAAGEDETAVLNALIDSLTTLQQRLDAATAKQRGAAVTELRSVLEHVPDAGQDAS